MKNYTFNSFLKTCFIILTIFCLVTLLPHNYKYRTYFDRDIVLFRHTVATLIFIIIAYRTWAGRKFSYAVIFIVLSIVYQPFSRIALGVFSPYLDIFISICLLIDIINFKGKIQLINWLNNSTEKNQ